MSGVCSIDEPGVRRVSLPDGRLLVIRRGGVDDIDRLIDFYRTLPLEDRYFRFFTGGMPPRSHFEKVLDPTRLAVALIVEVMDGSEVTLVGDACYVPQEDGAGELAVTISPEWRGWLGPYVLDTLIELAAANGIATLEAEILVRNRPMLALVRARGCVTIGDDDLANVRVAIGTTSRVPSWPSHDDRRRILVESGNPRWRSGMTRADPSLSVWVCPGPPAAYRDRCPMLSGRPCPLAAEADAIVVASSIDGALAGELIEAHRRATPSTPLFVETEPGETEALEPESATERAVALPRSLPRKLDDASAAAQLLEAMDEASRGKTS